MYMWDKGTAGKPGDTLRVKNATAPQTKNAYGVLQVYLYSFLHSAPDAGAWLASSKVSLPLGEKPQTATVQEAGLMRDPLGVSDTLTATK